MIDIQIRSKAGDKEVWDRGWDEAVAEFKASGYSETALIPKYVRSNKPVRVMGQVTQPDSPTFELDWYITYRSWVFETFLAGLDSLYELGSGTGWNLLAYARFNSEARVTGIDWADGAVEMAQLIGQHLSVNVTGVKADIREALPVQGSLGMGIATIGTLEQLGDRAGDALDMILAARPEVAVHIEPIVQWYGTSEADLAAAAYHRAKGFSDKIWPWVQDKAASAQIEIVYTQRSPVGSKDHDGYSLIVWKPCP